MDAFDLGYDGCGPFSFSKILEDLYSYRYLLFFICLIIVLVIIVIISLTYKKDDEKQNNINPE